MEAMRLRPVVLEFLDAATIAMAAAQRPTPTLADVPYEKHPKQVMHFRKAESKEPTPLLFYVHGGGWQGGNRLSGLGPTVPDYLKAGVSVVSIE